MPIISTALGLADWPGISGPDTLMFAVAEWTALGKPSTGARVVRSRQRALTQAGDDFIGCHGFVSKG
jgi:hypothetical protein